MYVLGQVPKLIRAPRIPTIISPMIPKPNGCSPGQPTGDKPLEKKCQNSPGRTS
jgi:hypothetical protein